MSGAQFHEAVRVLYHSPDDASKRQASAWLEQWQASPGAWDLAAAVLNAGGGGARAATADAAGGGAPVPVEARYLAAQTLRTKVRWRTSHCLILWRTMGGGGSGERGGGEREGAPTRKPEQRMRAVGRTKGVRARGLADPRPPPPTPLLKHNDTHPTGPARL